MDWRAAAVSNPRLINSDGVHPTGAGYQLRARLFASAIALVRVLRRRRCAAAVERRAATRRARPPAGRRGAATAARRAAAASEEERKPPRRPAAAARHESPVLLDVPVTFRGLQGELIAPGGEGRHPAVVMIQGRGRATREQFREQAEYLAEHGVAALIYDKRGPYRLRATSPPTPARRVATPAQPRPR